MSSALSGFTLSLSLIIAIGPQNAHVLRMGLAGRYTVLTAAACAITDLLLIFVGVLTVGELAKLATWVEQGMIGFAVAFLAWYGYQALQRMLNPVGNGLSTQSAALPVSAKQALATALAFSWLNPHAWLDTAVLIGGASIAHQQPNNYWFGLGAAAGSAAWFVVLAWVATRLAPYLNNPRAWQVIDGLVAITMWGTALWLGASLAGL
jgi:L-lysine exporter family protein LysE/ArgO